MASLQDFTQALYQFFPKLAEGNHELKSPYDPNYNCIAFALGLPRWRDPEPGDYRNTIRWIQKRFGYKRTRSSRPEPGYVKLAVYASSERAFKHVARQEGSGWVSKLGELHDLRHHDLNLLVGPLYGDVVAFLRRKERKSRRR
jgi:hypothetical protein